jgi:hypothetical protein
LQKLDKLTNFEARIGRTAEAGERKGFSEYTIDWVTEEVCFYYRQERKIILFTRTTRPAVGPNNPPIQCV